MPRPSKKSAEDKNKVPAHVVASQMVPQPMMPMGGHHGMPMQPQHHQQHRPQQPQQFMPQMQMPQQPPAPIAVPQMQPQSGRTVDSDAFITVRDSVSYSHPAFSILNPFSLFLCNHCISRDRELLQRFSPLQS